MRSYLKNNRKKLLGIGVVALILIVIISGKNDTSDAASTYTVVRKDVSDTLRLSGKVEAVNEVHMAFTGSGPVSQVYKHDGDKVVAGEKIVELDTASLRADLADAIANVNLQKANTQVSDAELDSDVLNAHTKLLSEDLVAYSVDPNSTITPPEVSGRYTLGTEGRYRVIVIPSGATSRMSIRYQGLEKGETEITFYKPIPLGSSGLYLKFNADETSVGDEWFIDIPNVGGASYTSNLNAYKSALASRDANAGEHISDAITMAKIAQAEARVASVSAQIEERILRAPFNGVVSKIDATRGEIVTASTPVATVISDNAFQVTVQIPEIDIVNVVPGLSASITLDAYGPSVVFPAKVTSVDTSQTTVDGVSVYEATVVFDASDPRILSGMTATVDVLKSKVEGVISVPASFLQTDDSGTFVNTGTIDAPIKTYVTTGLRGTNSDIEIRNGLSEGVVITGSIKN